MGDTNGHHWTFPSHNRGTVEMRSNLEAWVGLI